ATPGTALAPGGRAPAWRSGGGPGLTFRPRSGTVAPRRSAAVERGRIGHGTEGAGARGHPGDVEPAGGTAGGGGGRAARRGRGRISWQRLPAAAGPPAQGAVRGPRIPPPHGRPLRHLASGPELSGLGPQPLFGLTRRSE